jgi:glyoxylase I family protein
MNLSDLSARRTPMILKRLHHLALRCMDARATAKFYTEVLGMELVACAGGDRVPSNNEFSPHLNLFIKMHDGSMLDFVDVPLSPAAQKDPNTPAWVTHIAIEVDSMADLLEIKRRVEAAGAKVLGPTDHGFCQSIYFVDPSGHRLEMSWTNDRSQLASLAAHAWDDLAAWEEQKKLGWDSRTETRR